MSSNPGLAILLFFFQSDYFRDMQQFMLDWCSEWPLQSSLCTCISEFIYGGMKYDQKYSVIEILISIDKMQCFKKILPVRISSITVGSKSTKSALGTCFPELVSEKKVLKESSAIPSLSSDGI